MATASLTRAYRKPILLLFFLLSLIGEGLSGSTPPLAFLNPAVTLLLACLYGSGALLVRDYARRWQKGWRSILILGAAYGIVEEGIMVQLLQPNMEGPRSSRDIRSLARDELGLGRMAHDLPRNL